MQPKVVFEFLLPSFLTSELMGQNLVELQALSTWQPEEHYLPPIVQSCHWKYNPVCYQGLLFCRREMVCCRRAPQWEISFWAAALQSKCLCCALLMSNTTVVRVFRHSRKILGYVDIRSVYRPLHFEKNQIFRLEKVNTDSLLQVQKNRQMCPLLICH